MRAVIQRVAYAKITINADLTRNINKGLLVLAGIEDTDTQNDIDWLCKKIAYIRIFDDETGVMNLNVSEINGSIMVVSQFTLFARTKKGNRPSYDRASKPNLAIPIYNTFVTTLQKELNKPVITGEFGADMKIELLNDGPVTIIIDTKNKE